MKINIKDILVQLIIWYVIVIIVKIFMNKFTFDFNYFIEAIPLVIGFSLGYYTYEYFNNKKHNK